MAKRLLLNALVTVLGEFIELNEESLDLAVWSGSIVLHDLKLKTENILRNLNFTILNGTIKSLEIVIPWTSLLSSPIRISINGKCVGKLMYLDLSNYLVTKVYTSWFLQLTLTILIIFNAFKMSMRKNNKSSNWSIGTLNYLPQ